MPTVGDGDCVVSIADQLGLSDYHSLWDDGGNSGLKRKRPNPNQLVNGDEVKAPTAKTKTVSKAVDATWTFVVKTKKPPKLRLVIIDKDDKPLAGKGWRLMVGKALGIPAPKTAEGKIKTDGLIEMADIDPQEKYGKLQVTWLEVKKPPKKKAVPAAPKFKKPTYPRPIVTGEFKDADPAAPPADNRIMEWTLKIGSLPAFDHISGVQARLNNLGFRCDPDAQAARSESDIKAYQRTRLKSKTPSGVAADIQKGLRDRHDNP